MKKEARRENYIKMTKYLNTLNINQLKHLEALSFNSEYNIPGKYITKEDTIKQKNYLKKNWNLISELEEKEFYEIEKKEKKILFKTFGFIGGISGIYLGINFKRINKSSFLAMFRRGMVFGAVCGYFFVNYEKRQNFKAWNSLYFSVLNRNFGDQDVF